MNPTQYIRKCHSELGRQFQNIQQQSMQWPVEETAQVAIGGAHRMVQDWPMLGGLVNVGEDRLAATRVFKVTSDPFLKHHVFGPSSPESALAVQGIALLPFTFSMEIVAEAACRLAGWPSAHLTLSNLKAYRWLALDESELITEIEAKATKSPTGEKEVHVRIYEKRAGETPSRQLAFEGNASTEVRKLPSRVDRGRAVSPPNFSAEDFNSRIFHGPLLRTIRQTLHVDASGAEVEAVMPPSHGTFQDQPKHQMITPAALLDATGQLVGYWLMERQLPWFVLPIQLCRYEQFLPAPQSGTPVLLRSQISLAGGIAIADIEITRQDGAMLARIEGLKMKLYSLPDRYARYVFNYEPALRLSEVVALTDRNCLSREIDLSSHEFLNDGQSIWARLLARLLLSDEERMTWRRLPAALRLESLLGKITAKEAILDWLEGSTQAVGLPDIEATISKDRVLFHSRSLRNLPRLPDGRIERRGSVINVIVAAERAANFL
jgi:hypothetical protein